MEKNVCAALWPSSRAEPRQLIFAENYKNSKFIYLTIIPIRISSIFRASMEFIFLDEVFSIVVSAGFAVQQCKQWKVIDRIYISQILRLLYGLHRRSNGICRQTPVSFRVATICAIVTASQRIWNRFLNDSCRVAMRARVLLTYC